MTRIHLGRVLLSFVALTTAIACYRPPKLTPWTTGDLNAPVEVADVYRAVLDDIFPRAGSQPSLIVIDQMTEPSWLEIDFDAKEPRRKPDGVIAFKYKIPIIFLDTAAQRQLVADTRRADSIAYTVPMTDIRFRQREAGPFMERFPGAWGRLRFGRVGMSRKLDYAVVEARYGTMVPMGESGSESFRLARTSAGWKVVERIPRDGVIKPAPFPAQMLAGWVDSSTPPPPPRRTTIRGTVIDSASGAPIKGFAVILEAVPLDKNGYMIQGRLLGPWKTVFTDSAGRFAFANPPAGLAVIRAECAPTRDVPGASLASLPFQAEDGVDTVVQIRVRPAACAELAPAMAKEAERHRHDAKRADAEAAERAVQGNLWGTIRDSRTGRAVPRTWMRVDERGSLSVSDSAGAFWLWGFAPGRHKLILYCPVRRQWLGRVANTTTFDARAAMKDTMDINIDMTGCEDVPVDTVRIRSRGVLSEGFEDGFFTPCTAFTQIKLGGYRDFSREAYVVFARDGIGPPGGWPKIKPIDGYYKIFIDVDADLIGPGSYGHLGIGTYLLRVTRVWSAKAASGKDCPANP